MVLFGYSDFREPFHILVCEKIKYLDGAHVGISGPNPDISGKADENNNLIGQLK